MKQQSRQWYKRREQICTITLFQYVGAQYELWDINQYNRIDGKFWSIKKAGVFESVVRNFYIEDYDRHILEKWKLEGLYKYSPQIMYYINFFPAKEKERFDCIVYNISARLERWFEQKFIPYQISPFNRATYNSNLVKDEKQVVYLTFDKKLDMIVKGMYVKNYNL